MMQHSRQLSVDLEWEATPNAMVNMSALTECYGNTIKAYLLIPILGRLFADFINLLVITVFINLL